MTLDEAYDVVDDLDRVHPDEVEAEARSVIRAAEVEEARRYLADRPYMPEERRKIYRRLYPELEIGPPKCRGS